MQPLVSVITPVFNCEKYIEECINSVIKQSYENIEFIIIDGESTDNTIQIIEKYRSKITVFVSEKDKNMYDALNKGIKMAKGEIIHCLNADDFYSSPTVIENVVKSFGDEKAVVGNLIKFNEEKNHFRPIKMLPTNFEKLLCSEHCSFIPQPCLFLKKEVYDTIGAFDLKYNYASDFDFVLRVLKQFSVKPINGFTTTFRIHEESITSSGKINSERIEILEKNGLSKINWFKRTWNYYYNWLKYKQINPK